MSMVEKNIVFVIVVEPTVCIQNVSHPYLMLKISVSSQNMII